MNYKEKEAEIYEEYKNHFKIEHELDYYLHAQESFYDIIYFNYDEKHKTLYSKKISKKNDDKNLIISNKNNDTKRGEDDKIYEENHRIHKISASLEKKEKLAHAKCFCSKSNSKFIVPLFQSSKMFPDIYHLPSKIILNM